MPPTIIIIIIPLKLNQRPNMVCVVLTPRLLDVYCALYLSLLVGAASAAMVVAADFCYGALMFLYV